MSENEFDGQAEIITDLATVEAQTRAEVDMQIATAHRYPRNVAQSIETAIQLATENPEVAAGCFYRLPRDGKTIEGPTVRLAEIMAHSWKNSRAAARVIEVTQTSLTAQALFHDLESNTAIQREVRRRITKRDGSRYSEDMIGVAANAATSIAMRNAVFSVIPRLFVNRVLAAAKKTAIGEAASLQTRREKLLIEFAKLSITKADLLKHLCIAKVEEIGLGELEHLAGVYSSLREEIMTADAFRTVDRYGREYESVDPPAPKTAPGAKARAAAKREPASAQPQASEGDLLAGEREPGQEG